VLVQVPSGGNEAINERGQKNVYGVIIDYR